MKSCSRISLQGITIKIPAKLHNFQVYLLGSKNYPKPQDLLELPITNEKLLEWQIE